ncbi:MAG: hypothetical protein MUC88_11720 [Planctomycetes bacterium]|nr:hypothetical protein [Planctomycetota bacterium]
MSQEFGFGIKSDVGESGTVPACQFGRSVFGNQNASSNQLAHDLGAGEGDDSCPSSLFLLFDGGFCETGQRDEVASNRHTVFLFDVKNAHEFVQGITTPVGILFKNADRDWVSHRLLFEAIRWRPPVLLLRSVGSHARRPP